MRTAEFSGAFDDWPAALTEGLTAKQVGGAVLNCLICLEMFVLSLMHSYVWPPGETVQVAKGHTGQGAQDTLEGDAPLEESKLHDEEFEFIGIESGWLLDERAVFRRFLAVFNLSDIPRFINEIRRLGGPAIGRNSLSPGAKAREWTDLELDASTSPKMGIARLHG